MLEHNQDSKDVESCKARQESDAAEQNEVNGVMLITHKIKMYAPNNALFKTIILYLEKQTNGQKSELKLTRDAQKTDKRDHDI